MNTRTLAYLILVISLILLIAGLYLNFNQQGSKIVITPYANNITEWISSNMSVNNTTGVVKLGS
jgi:hypothetical protein